MDIKIGECTWVDAAYEEKLRAVWPVLTVRDAADLHSIDAHALAQSIHALIQSRPRNPTIEEIEAVITGKAP